MDIDVDAAYQSYLSRFLTECGDKPEGGFAKFGNVMIQRLSRKDFDERLNHYIRWHRECKRLLGSGATISDVLVLEFEEAAAWICIKAPNMLAMFSGELGDPDDLMKS